MNIGEVVRQTGLSEHTLRYYEKCGLLPAIRRDPAGQRLFTPQDLRWLEFLKKMRATRMPLKQMLRYGELLRQGDGTLTERRQMLERHEAKVRATIAEMQDALGVLQSKLDMYRDWESNGVGESTLCKHLERT